MPRVTPHPARRAPIRRARRVPRHTPRRLAAVASSIALLLCLSTTAALGMGAAGAGSTGGGAATHTSLPVIEPQVMCVTCKIPLNVAQSPQADRERAFIQGLIDEGQTEAQIKRSLVNQYGPTVLALPSAHGFDLTVYLVPLAAFLALLATLAVLLPRWRRHAREQASRTIDAPQLSSADTARLDADLAKFD
jgi:cytochrome c-type biogenesis protein CcmH/NrfF